MNVCVHKYSRAPGDFGRYASTFPNCHDEDEGIYYRMSLPPAIPSHLFPGNNNFPFHMAPAMLLLLRTLDEMIRNLNTLPVKDL